MSKSDILVIKFMLVVIASGVSELVIEARLAYEPSLLKFMIVIASGMIMVFFMMVSIMYLLEFFCEVRNETIPQFFGWRTK